MKQEQMHMKGSQSEKLEIKNTVIKFFFYITWDEL